MRIAGMPERSFMRAKGDASMGEYTDKAKGKIKQVVGGVTGNKRLQREGELDELKGKAKGAAKDVKRAIKKAAK